jgi:hypothetical protein
VKYKGEKYVLNDNHMFIIDHVFGGIAGTWGFRGS